MRENLKQLIRSLTVSNADDIIEEYESEQTFTELEDGTFEN